MSDLVVGVVIGVLAWPVGALAVVFLRAFVEAFGIAYRASRARWRRP